MTDTQQHIFNSHFKAQNRLWASTALVLTAVLPFGLALVLIMLLLPEPKGVWAAVMTLLAFVGSGGLTWLIQDRVALLGNNNLRKRVYKKLSAQEINLEGTIFTGFSPGVEVRSWEGETDLDVGYLKVTAEMLYFYGDTYLWALHRDRVDNIDLTPVHMGPRRIIINWHEPRESQRALTLESRNANSLRATNDLTADLYRSLREWVCAPPTPEQEQTVFLGYPPVDLKDGRPVDELAPGSCAVTLGMGVIIILTIWHMVSSLIEEGLVYYAALSAGLIFVGGAVLTRCILHYLQSTTKPASHNSSSTSRP